MKAIKLSIISAMLWLSASTQVQAQNATLATKSLDQAMPRWFVGANARLGTQFMQFNQLNYEAQYLNRLNADVSKLEVNNGLNYGLDLNLGYFFGKKRNFGLATGVQWLAQQYTYSLDRFALEFQANDFGGNVFRQGLRMNSPLEEQMRVQSIGLPILLLYKKQFNKRWGMNIDAGVVLNLISKASYQTNARFDYEAIYKFDANNNPVFDDSPTPDPNNWLITKAHYQKVNADGNVNTYFENLHQQGYNVGLDIAANNQSTELKNYTINTSFFIQPGISYAIKPNLTLHGQVAYRRLAVSQDLNQNFQLTNERGSYQSVNNSLSNNTHNLLSFALGLRYYFGKERASEPAKPKAEPTPVVEKAKPDPKKEMVLVEVKLIDEKYGNPVAGKIIIKQGDKEVYNGQANASGTSSFYLNPGNYTVGVSAKGYVPAYEYLSLLASEKGKSKTIELQQPKIEKGLVFKAKTLNFETGSDRLASSSFDILNNMANMLTEYPQMQIEIAGHTDNVGDDNLNLSLSQKRADAVKNYLVGKGANVKQINAKGYGESKPITGNDTEEGRLKNRRVEFSVLEF